MLFSTLDTNKSETLEWDEFCILAHHCQTCISVVDYIPLHEIEGVEFEIHLKATKGGQRPEKAGLNARGPSFVPRQTQRERQDARRVHHGG